MRGTILLMFDIFNHKTRITATEVKAIPHLLPNLLLQVWLAFQDSSAQDLVSSHALLPLRRQRFHGYFEMEEAKGRPSSSNWQE